MGLMVAEQETFSGVDLTRALDLQEDEEAASEQKAKRMSWGSKSPPRSRLAGMRWLAGKKRKEALGAEGSSVEERCACQTRVRQLISGIEVLRYIDVHVVGTSR